MATKIEWTDEVWNPVTGCDKVSQGCKHCYAEVMHRRLRGMFPQKYSKPFLGNVQIHFDELTKPYTWKKPRVVFVNSMSDLFHGRVSFGFIDTVFSVMEKTPEHTYQVLTKRGKRMASYAAYRNDDGRDWPANVWAGVSCEDQETADERIAFLITIPASVRFISCEPLLGPITLNPLRTALIDWVIVGGESGNKKTVRPVHPDWVRSLRDHCSKSNVPFFFKQWGEFMPYEREAQPPFYTCSANGAMFDGHFMNHMDPETGDPGKWEGYRWEDPLGSMIMCEETGSSECTFLRMGKKNSGNMLDGKQHLEFPKSLNQKTHA